MKKYRRRLFFAGLTWLGLLLLVGTVGAMETDNITMQRGIVQASVIILVTWFAAIKSNG